MNQVDPNRRLQQLEEGRLWRAVMDLTTDLISALEGANQPALDLRCRERAFAKLSEWFRLAAFAFNAFHATDQSNLQLKYTRIQQELIEAQSGILSLMEGVNPLQVVDWVDFSMRGEHILLLTGNLTAGGNLVRPTLQIALSLVEDVFKALRCCHELPDKISAVVNVSGPLVGWWQAEVTSGHVMIPDVTAYMVDQAGQQQRMYNGMSHEVTESCDSTVIPSFRKRLTTAPPPSHLVRVSRFPEDLLYLIFRVLFDDSELRDTSFPPFQIAVSHICRHWRTVALSARLIWRRCIYRCSKDVLRNAEWIQRSGETEIHLHVLGVSEIYIWPENRMRLLAVSESALLPRICHLTIEGRDFDLDSFLGHITSAWSWFDSREYDVTCDKLFKRISLMPSLQRLDIGEVWMIMSDESVKHITAALPNLRRVEIRQNPLDVACACFIRRICAPQLHHLSIILSYQGWAGRLRLPSPLRHIKLPAMPVRKLDLQTEASSEDVMRLMQALPDLESLRVYDSLFFSDECCVAIVSVKLMPMLHTLLLHTCPHATGDGLVYLLRALGVGSSDGGETYGSRTGPFNLSFNNCPLVVGKDKSWLIEHTVIVHWEPAWLSEAL